MIHASDVTVRLREVPFVPFRIVTSSGAVHDVHHPEMYMVTRRFLIVGIIDPHDPLLPDQVTNVSILHISELRSVPSTVAA